MINYNNTNISQNTNINSPTSYLFNSDSHSPTNSSNSILRGNNVTPSNSTITATSSLETPLSDMSDILSTTSSNASKIMKVNSHNYMNLTNQPLTNYNGNVAIVNNNPGNMNNMNNINKVTQAMPLTMLKNNSPTLSNKNILSGNTPILSTIQMMNDKPNNGMKIKNKNSIGGITANNVNSTSFSNEYVDTYHRRITMEERRMCQSSEENRKNKNGNNNSNINDRQLNQSSNTGSKRHVIPRGNELILSRVISGLDDRTTFMIRNIPNKYTQQMLIDTINDTHFGQFDFLYLRMDFKNRCNVGYAFINFVDIKAVISFAEKVVGKKWTRFNSDKICTLSYANIQGRDSLIEKFKNSSVMLEDPSYRPKIFYTSGELKGQEEPFPPPTVPLQFKPYSSVLLNSNLQKTSTYSNNNSNNNSSNNNSKVHDDKIHDNNTTQINKERI
jgi:hypothetical protein